MKKLTLTLCAVTALVSATYAGTETYSGKEMKQTQQTMETPCPTWYADNEFNVSISGVYAPTANEYREDTYLGVDHGWGAAIDAKFFFRRYFGVGIQGFGLSINNSRNDFLDQFDDDENNDFAGGVLGTFTFRYPIPCTRFAPYGWAGVGAIFGGGNGNRLVFDDDDIDFPTDNRGEDDARLMAQYGLGFEVRFTPHLGLLNDVSYNHLEGGFNDFWQVRTGLNFAF
ncbi:MAG: autotransporter outer membrane beta-barrel domain-containing protein [Chthoniobacterales bacterium]|nr:autotransporter outer membrane beta-barrel domain-containing protein [Chthoniobacterales bacterium]